MSSHEPGIRSEVTDILSMTPDERDRAERIRSIVEAAPPLTSEQKATIGAALAASRRRQELAREVKKP